MNGETVSYDETDNELQTATQAAFDKLERPFAPHELKQRPGGGGVMLDYIEWTKAVRRMDEAVGKDNWGFECGEPRFFGDNQQGYVVCTGKMTVTFPNGKTTVKGSMGGCAFGQGGRGMSPDDAAKGAASDALKKCASLYGVALDLSEKDGPRPQQGGYQQQSNGYGGGQQGGQGYGTPAPSGNQGGGYVPNGQQGGLNCEICGDELTETRFKDQTVWNPAQLASFGKRKHGKVLDMKCYREANQAARRAEEALQSVPF
jgi:hypothetical protein